MADLRPTPRLRWIQRELKLGERGWGRDLQQWWAEDMPSYMRDQAKGEWRDVPTESE